MQNGWQGMFCGHPHRAPVEISIDSMIFAGYGEQKVCSYLVEESASLSNNQIGMSCEKPQFAYGVERQLCKTRWSSLHSIFKYTEDIYRLVSTPDLPLEISNAEFSVPQLQFVPALFPKSDP